VRTIHTKHAAGDNRSKIAARCVALWVTSHTGRWGALSARVAAVLPPDRRGAFVARRARGVGQKKTVVDVDGDSSARRRRNGRRGDHRKPKDPHHPHHAYRVVSMG
jgi:hypothetical protein